MPAGQICALDLTMSGRPGAIPTMLLFCSPRCWCMVLTNPGRPISGSVRVFLWNLAVSSPRIVMRMAIHPAVLCNMAQPMAMS